MTEIDISEMMFQAIQLTLQRLDVWLNQQERVVQVGDLRIWYDHDRGRWIISCRCCGHIETASWPHRVLAEVVECYARSIMRTHFPQLYVSDHQADHQQPYAEAHPQRGGVA